jgi:hypothetical protein
VASKSLMQTGLLRSHQYNQIWPYPSLTALGESCDLVPYGRHKAAEAERALRAGVQETIAHQVGAKAIRANELLAGLPCD